MTDVPYSEKVAISTSNEGSDAYRRYLEQLRRSVRCSERALSQATVCFSSAGSFHFNLAQAGYDLCM